jgi:DNA-binding phage protein
MFSENEMNQLAQFGDEAWLYFIMNCKGNPELYRIQNPAKALNFELKAKEYNAFCQWQNGNEK